MKKRSLIAVALGVSVVIAFGGLYASNMGFKLNQLLESSASADSASGQTQLGLPYNPQTSIVNAADLRADINATAGAEVVVQISRFVKSNDTFTSYTGPPLTGDNYAIDGIEGQRIQVSAPVNYIVVGSHDPGRVITLLGSADPGSASGQTELSFPYHGTAVDAAALRDEINAAAGADVVVQISRFVRSNDTFVSYTGPPLTGVNFPTAPGESYRIQVSQTVPSYIPSHY